MRVGNLGDAHHCRVYGVDIMVDWDRGLNRQAWGGFT